MRIGAKIDPTNFEYYRAVIEPLLDHPLIEYVGEVTDLEKDDFLGDAYVQLCPSDWPEPFGLVFIESMACGTPVIAYRRGSVPEIIDHGVTGFICDTLEEMTQSVPSYLCAGSESMPTGVRSTLLNRAHGPRLCARL